MDVLSENEEEEDMLDEVEIDGGGGRPQWSIGVAGVCIEHRLVKTRPIPGGAVSASLPLLVHRLVFGMQT